MSHFSRKSSPRFRSGAGESSICPRSLARAGQESFESLCEGLASSRGEASGVALARRILDRYEEADPAGKDAIFAFLASRFVPSAGEATKAAEAYLKEPGPETLERLAMAVESPRQELLRRLNLAPGGTAALVRMREDLLQRMNTSLTGVDRDFVHLFSSWFNRGFLVLSRMSWSSPASILEKIIAYEAVHEIKGWDDLRRRLDPHDRRCFAFFHPALVDEPLIFVEVALCGDMPGSIHTLLDSEGGAEDADPEPSVAVFYSISNCQEGLRGISFGNFLIKQVVEELTREVPSLKTFVTLSPAPSFRSWLFRALGDGQLAYLGEAERSLLHKIREQGWSDEEAEQDALRPRRSCRGRALLPAGERPLRPAARSGRALPSRQRRAPRTAQLARGYLRKRCTAGLELDGQLPL